jgi:hypothetical protein
MYVGALSYIFTEAISSLQVFQMRVFLYRPECRLLAKIVEFISCTVALGCVLWQTAKQILKGQSQEKVCEIMIWDVSFGLI